MRSVSLQHRAAVGQSAMYEFERHEKTRWNCTKKMIDGPCYVLTVIPCSVISCGIGCAGCARFAYTGLIVAAPMHLMVRSTASTLTCFACT